MGKDTRRNGKILKYTASNNLITWEADNTSEGTGDGADAPISVSTGSKEAAVLVSSPTSMFNFSTASFRVYAVNGSTAFIVPITYQSMSFSNANFMTTNFPQIYVSSFLTNPEPALLFDAAVSETAYFVFRAVNYVVGSSITIHFGWHATNGTTTGDIIWGAQVSTLTANQDTIDTLVQVYTATHSVVDSHLGTAARRIHETSVGFGVADLLGLNTNGLFKVAVHRNGNGGADTMAGKGYLVYAYTEY